MANKKWRGAELGSKLKLQFDYNNKTYLYDKDEDVFMLLAPMLPVITDEELIAELRKEMES